MGDLHIFSVNVNGLNSPQKRNRIFTQLKKIKAGIICIQETHIKAKDQHLLKNKKLGELFIASDGKKKKKGVATYVIDDLKPKLVNQLEDGRILLVEIQKDLQKILIVNIYAPNTAHSNFF